MNIPGNYEGSNAFVAAEATEARAPFD